MPSNGGTSKARIEVRPRLSELHIAEPPLPILPAPNDSELKTHTRSKSNLSSDHHSHRVLFGRVGSGYAAAGGRNAPICSKIEVVAEKGFAERRAAGCYPSH